MSIETLEPSWKESIYRQREELAAPHLFLRRLHYMRYDEFLANGAAFWSGVPA